MKAIGDIRLRIQCANVLDHAKILPIQNFVDQAPAGLANVDERELKLYFARRMGELICGNSTIYVYKPGNRSPIGRCVLCGGALSFEIQERDTEQKERIAKKRPDRNSVILTRRRKPKVLQPREARVNK